MLGHLESEAKARTAPNEIPAGVLDAVVPVFARQFDAENGGFGAAPKFPPSMRLELLIRRWTRTGAPAAREMVEKTLTKMASGGMYDQVGGGFHRYSVDATWTVPHFEKMLYDNAMLARVYALAYRAFGRPEDARIVRETLDYLLREMTPDDGGFFAAQDADSEGEEGTFYVWTPASVEEAVGAEAPLVCARFGVTPQGNFENGATVLTLAKSIPELAAELGRSEEEIEVVLRDAREKMYAARSRRVPPGTDDKQLTDWTGLAISAFAIAGRILREPRYVDAAGAAAERVLRQCMRDGELLHRARRGNAAIDGFATDYAFLVEGLLDLYEATFESRYLAEALRAPEDPRRALRGSPRRLLPLGGPRRGADRPAARDLRRRDALVELGRRLESPAHRRPDGRRGGARTGRRDLLRVRGAAPPGALGVPAAALRAGFPGRRAARGRAGRRARSRRLRRAVERRVRLAAAQPRPRARRVRRGGARALVARRRKIRARRSGPGVRVRAFRVQGADRGAGGAEAGSVRTETGSWKPETY